MDVILSRANYKFMTSSDTSEFAKTESYYTDSTVMLLVMDSIYTKANDSDLVSLGEGFCRRRFP